MCRESCRSMVADNVIPHYSGGIDHAFACKLFCEEVVEGANCGEFVVLDVEDRREIGDVEDVLDILGEAEQFKLASSFAGGREAADELSNTGAVDVVDPGEVENNLLLAFS